MGWGRISTFSVGFVAHSQICVLGFPEGFQEDPSLKTFKDNKLLKIKEHVYSWINNSLNTGEKLSHRFKGIAKTFESSMGVIKSLAGGGEVSGNYFGEGYSYAFI